VVHYNSASSKGEAEAAVEEIANAGGKAWSFQADLTKVDEIAALFATAKGKGKITVAINTAGKVLKKPILDVSIASGLFISLVDNDSIT
jgi:NAD(P)-dependent dehydrogenase (short-subunit alcohol dehydrogenase family)